MTPFSDYESCLYWLYTQLPMYQRQGAVAMKKDLTNISVLLAHLGNPQDRFDSIHIGGTNGKGTVAHLMAATLQSAGLRTGLYTSPHYQDFRERIKIDGSYVEQSFVLSFTKDIQSVFEQVRPSFFEMTVAMAFQYFAEQKVDVAVIEVGLGGRLDSTNILSPKLSIITNISYDHQAMLGNTLTEIAGEKAGIIKSDTPIIIGKKQVEVQDIFLAKAKEMNAPLYFAEDVLNIELCATHKDKSEIKIQSPNAPLPPKMWVDLAGPYQLENIQTALAAGVLIQQKQLFEVNEQQLIEGFENVKHSTRYQGRWQYIGHRPDVLVDGAHNQAGIASVLAAIDNMEYRRLHLVLGFVNDKDLNLILPLFPLSATYYFGQANIPRALPSAALQQQASQVGLEGKAYPNIEDALTAARASAQPDDLIFVGGSIFTVAEVLP